jgi:hypothetical protein
LGLLVLGVSLVGLAVVAVVTTAGERENAEMVAVRVFLGFLIVGGVGFCAAAVLMLGAVPTESGAKAWAAGLIIFSLLAAIVSMAAYYGALKNEDWRRENAGFRIGAGGAIEKKEADAPPWDKTVFDILSYTREGTSVLANICLSLLLFQVGRHFRKNGLAASCLVYLFLSTLFVAALYALPILAAQNLDVAEMLKAAWMPWAIMGSMAVFTLWLILNMLGARGAITRAILGKTP